MIDLEQANKDASSYNLEAIVSFDDRGQLVIPKDVRKKFKLNAGEKFALISCDDSDGKLCCFYMIKTNKLQGMLHKALAPAIENITK